MRKTILFLCFLIFLILISGARADAEREAAMARLIASLNQTADTGMPEIQNVEIIKESETAARINWETDRFVNSSIYYGRDHTSLQPLLNLSLNKNHSVLLRGLTRGTRYYFKLCGDEDELRNFITPGPPPPRVTGFSSSPFSDSAVKLSWGTNVETIYNLKIYNSSNLKYEFSKENFSDSAALAVSGLTPNSVYDYVLECEDERGDKTLVRGVFNSKKVNLALNKRAEGTFDRFDNDPAANNEGRALDRLTDGDLNSFTGMAASGNINDAEQWAIIDLEEEVRARTAAVIWRGNYYSTDYSIYISKDKKEWIAVKENINAGEKGKVGRSPSGDLIRTVITGLPEENFRYFKLEAAKGRYFNHWSRNVIEIFEIEILK